MANYSLPGVQLTDITDIPPTPITAEASSSQRLPCFIGTASLTKEKYYESVARNTVGYIDNLVSFATGITSIIGAGTQSGLNDLVEGVDFTVNYLTGEVTWLIHTETRVIKSGVAGEELFSSLTDFASFATAVPGVNAKEGSQGIGLDIISGANSGLVVGQTYTFGVNGTEYSFNAASSGTDVSIGDVATSMNAALASSPFVAAFVTSDIVVSTSAAGVGNTVTLAAGALNDLFTALALTVAWTAFKVAVPGADATQGTQGLGLAIVGADDTGLLPDSRYYFKLNNNTYSILTGAGVTTYTLLAGLLDTALTAANVNVAITLGEDRKSVV